VVGIESNTRALGGVVGIESNTRALGGVVGIESNTRALGGVVGIESNTRALGGVVGIESDTRALGGVVGIESVSAKAVLASAQPATKAIRLTFIMMAPNSFVDEGDMRVTGMRFPAHITATQRPEFPHIVAAKYA
jgi:hypothetical protein